MFLPRLSLSLVFIACAISLAGCDQAKPPESFTEVAVQGVYSITLSHTGDTAMVGSLHHGGSFWTLKPANRYFDWNHKSDGYSNITSSAFAPDDDFVATSDTRTIVLWDVATGESIWYWNAPGDIKDIALTRNGAFALLGMSDYSATLFDIRNGGIRQRLPHDGIVYDVSLDDEGLLGASASDDLTAVVWNLNDGSQLQVFRHDNQVRTAQLSPSGRLLFTSALREPGRVWDVRSGKLLKELPGGRGHFTAARFNSSESQLLTGNTSGQIQLWSLSSGEQQAIWRATTDDQWVGSNQPVEDVAFAGSGYLAAGANGRVYFLKK